MQLGNEPRKNCENDTMQQRSPSSSNVRHQPRYRLSPAQQKDERHVSRHWLPNTSKGRRSRYGPDSRSGCCRKTRGRSVPSERSASGSSNDTGARSKGPDGLALRSEQQYNLDKAADNL